MNKRKKWIAAIAVALAIAGCVVGFSGPREPRYDGHPLSYWVARFETPEAKIALAAIGTNGLPWLVEWVDAKPSRIEVFVNSQLRRLPRRVQPYWQMGTRKYLAGYTLGLLGTNAAEAVPALLGKMDWGWGGGSPHWIVGALAEIGPQAIPGLLAAVEVDSDRAHLVVWTLAYMSESQWHSRSGADLREVAAAMAKLVHHDDEEVRLEAIAKLTWLNQRPIREQTLELLTELLRDPSAEIRLRALNSLSMFSDLPARAQISIKNLQNDPDVQIRRAADQALIEIHKVAASEQDSASVSSK